ncbi:MAG: metallophosphoesterase family protein [Leadbetterella sp.]|nr:metallophosphoesterase family protein [Leadbetterella sp.]
MLRVGLISDTHSYLDPTVFTHFETCHEIWHIGDIGDEGILRDLSAFRPTFAVYGNIDGGNLRYDLPEDLFLEREGLRILLTHIGGLPGKFPARVKNLIRIHRPDLFICGHSHILRVIKGDGLVYINPGAAGHHGFHAIRTLMRMELSEGRISHLEAIELGKR